jgi:hypothetical protein
VVLIAGTACHGKTAGSTPIPGDGAPAITVEVLNAGGHGGEARQATRLLRNAGLDVVFFGNASGGNDSTRIIVRRGSRDVGERVRAALGVGTVAVGLDSSRLLDVSVLLGADFVARAQSLDFHP